MCVSAPSHRASIYVYCIPSTLAAVDGETYSPLSLSSLFSLASETAAILNPSHSQWRFSTEKRINEERDTRKNTPTLPPALGFPRKNHNHQPHHLPPPKASGKKSSDRKRKKVFFFLSLYPMPLISGVYLLSTGIVAVEEISTTRHRNI